MRLVGVDEAGKGPVLGAMFAAAVRVPTPEALPAGIADSKRLTPEKREDLVAALRADDRIDSSIASVSVARIDDPSIDMNTLTVGAHADAAVPLLEDGDRVVADASDVRAGRFARRLTERIPADVVVDATHGADESNPVVGAASVLAKVERDAHVDRLADAYGEIGSGYPSDPTTREFLRNWVRSHGTLPPCARASWRTSADVLAAAEQSVLSEF